MMKIALIGTLIAALLPGSAAPAEKALRGAAVEAIAGSYIVVLKGNTVDSAITTLADRHGGAVGHTYRHAISGFEFKGNERAARRIAADPSVAYVERNHPVHVAGTQANPTWSLDRLDRHGKTLNKSYEYPNIAEWIHAYIIDTGIRMTHQEFAGGRAISGYDFIDNDLDASDCYGHGTHVAGIVGGATYGVAKGVRLVSVRVADCNANGSEATVIAGVDWVTGNAVRPAVVNMSLTMTSASSSLDSAVTASIASGLTYSVPAGNGLNDNNPVNACLISPARVSTAITVAASNSSDSRASFSNYGNCVDIFAPGDDILSAYAGSDTLAAWMRGTSLAAPHVTGAAAMILAQHNDWTPQQIRDQIVNLDPTVGALSNIGTGSPNKLLFVRSGPLKVNLSCNVPTGSYSCSAEAIGAVAPVTYTWSTSPSGGCIVTKNINITVTVRDSLNATASSSRSFVCRGRCDLQGIGAFCLAILDGPASAHRREF